jgi:hypothetical protein
MEGDLVETFIARASDVSTAQQARKLLSLIGAASLDVPTLVHALATTVLASPGAAALGDDLPGLLEQSALAALAVGNQAAARAHIDALKVQFPTSARVDRLALRLVEASGHAATAEEGYRAALKKDGNDPASVKRLIAIKKGRGDMSGAMADLAAYLAGLGAGDAGAWLDAAELQLALPNIAGVAGSRKSGRLAQAAFCMEELILLQPANAAFHARAAELLVGQGCGGEGAEGRGRIARLHAAEAVRLTGKGCAYAIVALADAAYVHWCAVTGARPGPLALPCCSAAAAPSLVAAVEAGEGFPVSAGAGGDETGPPVARAEAAALHALALRLLQALAASPAGAHTRRQAAGSVTAASVTVKLSAVFPALALEAALLGPRVEALLAARDLTAAPST